MRLPETDTVIVLDQDGEGREHLAALLRSVGLDTLFFDTPEHFFSARRPSGPACLLLDVRLRGMTGFECQQRLKDEGDALPIVFLTAHGDVPMAVRAMKAGAIDFLMKPCRDQDLLDAVHAALSRDRDRRAVVEGNKELRARFESLTPREQEILTWVVSGRLNKEIAAELGTSEITVKVHRSNVIRKMQVQSVAQLVRVAERLGIPFRA